MSMRKENWDFKLLKSLLKEKYYFIDKSRKEAKLRILWNTEDFDCIYAFLHWWTKMYPIIGKIALQYWILILFAYALS